MDSNEILKADLDDLLFEGRNKSYGAYVLRKLYDKHLKRGTLLAAILFLLIIFSPVIVGKIGEALRKKDDLVMKEVTLAEPPPIDPNQPPPPPPPPPVEPPPVKATIKFVPPKVMADEKVQEEEPPPTVEEMKDVVIAKTTQEGEKGDGTVGLDDGKGKEAPPPVAEEPPPPKPEQVFTIVEQMPSFPDGEAALFKWLRDNIKYPAIARENSIEGKVYVGFVVNTDGSITDVTVKRGVTGGAVLNDEAIRVVKAMPKWKPGRQQGREVRVSYTLPIQFKLE